MSQTCRIRVRESERESFKYSATFVWEEPEGRATPLVPADLYAEGDLAVYLEDWGAEVADIVALLESLKSTPSGEIAIVMPVERLEVLSSQPQPHAAPAARERGIKH
jgi:hypothetical protein